MAAAQGDYVSLHSLQSATQYNGKNGRLIDFSHGTGRWKVELLDSGEHINVKPENMRHTVKLDPAQSAEFQRVTDGLDLGQFAEAMITGAELARQKMVKDGQREGGFDLSALIDLPQCGEGWVISWTQTKEVDDGKLVFLCLVIIHQPLPKPGHKSMAPAAPHGKPRCSVSRVASKLTLVRVRSDAQARQT